MSDIRIRDLRQSHWPDMKIADYRSGPLETPLFHGKKGMEAVFRVAEINEPLNVGTAENPFIVSDVDYWWHVFAPEDSFFWMSTAFSPEKELIEIYFDITAGNDFSDPENPCNRDLYLDLVVSPEGRVKVLDEDELSEALDAGEITEAEAEGAKAHCEALRKYLVAHAEEVLEFARGRMQAERP